MSIPTELIVYIHGVSSDLRGRDHAPDYESLHEGVAAHNAAWPTRFLGVEWGWNHDSGAPKSQQLLTDAQRQLGARAMPALMGPRDFTVNPARAALNSLRSLLLYGFADMFYYVSADGKAAIRDAVASQIIDYVDEEHGDSDDPVSITILGHSAGSVIAFDFLFSLFYRGDDHVFVKHAEGEADCGAGMARLRQLAGTGKLRLRRFYTFGSPITMLACRSDAVLGILAKNRELDPVDYGLTSQLDGDRLDGIRWLNLWDRDDPIAWPIEPLIGDVRKRPVAEDVYVDVSDSVTKSHTTYWRSEKVHRLIAGRW